MTTATTPLVLCLPRAEPHPDPESILLHVAPNGASPLDLKLVGTESSEVFTISSKICLFPSPQCRVWCYALQPKHQINHQVNNMILSQTQSDIHFQGKELKTLIARMGRRLVDRPVGAGT